MTDLLEVNKLLVYIDVSVIADSMIMVTVMAVMTMDTFMAVL